MTTVVVRAGATAEQRTEAITKLLSTAALTALTATSLLLPSPAAVAGGDLALGRTVFEANCGERCILVCACVRVCMRTRACIAAIACCCSECMPPSSTAAAAANPPTRSCTAACHAGGNNSVIPDHTLRKAAIEQFLDGGLNLEAIVYQVRVRAMRRDAAPSRSPAWWPYSNRCAVRASPAVHACSTISSRCSSRQRGGPAATPGSSSSSRACCVGSSSGAHGCTHELARSICCLALGDCMMQPAAPVITAQCACRRSCTYSHHAAVLPDACHACLCAADTIHPRSRTAREQCPPGAAHWTTMRSRLWPHTCLTRLLATSGEVVWEWDTERDEGCKQAAERVLAVHRRRGTEP